MTSLGAEETNASVLISNGASYGETPVHLLGFDFTSNYSRRVYLKPICSMLEEAVPGLAGQLIHTLNELNWSVAELLTPASVFDMYSHYAWGGYTTDADYAEYCQEMGDEESTGFMPSSFWAQLGPEYQAWTGRGEPGASKLWTYKRLEIEAASAPAWVRDVILMLVRLRKLKKKVPHVDGLKDKHSFRDNGNKWQLEPSFAFWWTEDDDNLDTQFEDIYQYRAQCDDDYSELIFENLVLNVESAAELVDWIERAIPFLVELERFRLYLWSKQHEKRRRVRRGK